MQERVSNEEAKRASREGSRSGEPGDADQEIKSLARDLLDARARVKELEKWRDAVLSIVDSLDDPYGDSWNETSQEDCAGELEHIRSVLVPLVGIVFNKFLWIFWIWNKSWYRIRNRGGEMSALVCEHGSLRRKCEICERDGRIKELEARVKELGQVLVGMRDMAATSGRRAISVTLGFLDRVLSGEEER